MRESNKLVGAIVIILAILISTVLVIPMQIIGIENNNNSMYGTITGKVIDEETDEPINYALMTLKYHEETHYTVTDSNGYYSFYKVPICFCLKNISAEKTGYYMQHRYVPVDRITYVNFSLVPIEDTPKDDPEEPDDHDDHEPYYGKITGVVVDDKIFQPISDAKMTLKYHDEIHIKFTDSEGLYTFNKVPLCFCLKNVSAQKNGYLEEFELIAVSEVTYVNFSLTPKDSSQEPDDEVHKGIVKGVVIDAVTNFPIEDIYIVLKYHEILRHTYTDSEGKYSFSDVPECNCTKDISADKEGYKIQNIQISVYSVTYLNFSLEPTKEQEEPNDPNNGMYGTIYGTVLDADSKLPIKNAIIDLKYHDKTRNTKTNSEGEFKFNNVPICYCLKNITVTKNDYITQSQLIPVNETTTVNFFLKKTNSKIVPPQDLPPKSDDKQNKYTEDQLYENINGLGITIIGIACILVVLFISGGLFFILKNKNKRNS